MGLPSVKEAERRRHPRVPISGSARVLFHGSTMIAEMFDASRDGARLQITTDELDLELNEQVLIQPSRGETSVAFLCKVRHLRLVSESSSHKVFSVGVEHAAAHHQNKPDLLALLISTGIVSIANDLPEASVLGVMDQSGSVINELRHGIRQSSMMRIVTSKLDTPELEEVTCKSLALQGDHWKVMIGIQSPAMNVEFSSYYTLASARRFYSRKKNSPMSEVEDRLCHDFMREFCNLTAGAIKIWVERHAGSLFWQKDLRVQLPIQAKADGDGAMHPNAAVSSDTTALFDAWRLKESSGDFITCFSNITIRDWAAVKSLQSDDESATKSNTGTVSEDEDIEFL